jgi:hypothetical protein
MRIDTRLKFLATAFATLLASLPSLQATKVAGSLDANNGLVLSLLPDPVGRPAQVVVSNAGGTQFITQANTGLTVSSYNSAPTAPQSMGSLPGVSGDVLSQVLTFVDGIVGQQVIIAVNQSRSTGGTTIAALQGKVTLNLPGGQTLKIDVGSGAVVDNAGKATTQTIAQIIQAEKQAGGGKSVMADYILQAVQEVAADVAAGTLNGDAATKQLAAIVQMAAQADPSQAAAFVSTAVAAIGSNSTVGSAAAISAVVTAATSGNGSLKATVMAAATVAASAKGITFTESTLATNTGPLNQTFTTPVAIDITVVSRSN